MESKNLLDECQQQESPFPSGWTCIPFIDSIRKIPLTNKKLKQSEYLETGLVPVVDQGQTLIGGYTNRSDLQISLTEPVIIFGDHTRVVKYINFNFVAGAEGVKPFHVQPWFNPKFLYYIIKAANLPDKGYARHFQYLEKISVPLPPLPEQHRIVTRIEELLTQLDAGVASLLKAQAQLRRYRQAVLKAAFEGRLTQEWRIKHSEIPDSEKWVKKLFSDMGKTVNDDTLIKNHILPKKWISVNLGELKLFSLYGPRFSSDDYSKTGFFVIRTSDINESGKINLKTAPRLPLNDDEFSRYKVEKGDLLITRTGSLGTLALFNDKVNAIPGAYLIQYHLISPIITNWYIFYFLKSPIGQKKLIGGGSGVGRPNLNAPKIDSIKIPLPPLEEQGEIVSEIERILSIITHLEQSIQISLSESDLLRQSILKRAFEGKLVPQDPNDEPASILLERIKADKALHAAEGKKGKAHQPASPKKKVRHAR